MSSENEYITSAGYPSIEAYMHLRQISGLSPKTREQAEPVPANSWYGVIITHQPSGEVIGMGRIIGDGGWYFHIADMAVHPDHQRKGLGKIIINNLLNEIKERVPASPYISLLADPPGRKLYANNGFVETAPNSLGMVYKYTATE
ncbi:N-acetyltransferase GCN5 [Microthyrium microscopicum]|uniref:N-acetyltransferase GCN5 n=1 Tax=Microthyrium microscopicum TaxID=703497 RepID=A0A6A6USY7_9PEZI|nr:N-acetyltransferase GCN5 [Microthyrium microscopicum]